MNIIFLVNQDIYANYALNLLLPNLDQHQKVVYCSSSVGVQTSKPKALKNLAYWEQEWFNNIVCTQLDSIPLQSDKLRSWKGLNSFLVEPVSLLNHINSVAGQKLIASMSPDLIVSIRFGKILQMPVIATPTFGVINLHSGLLPQYRGVMATFWSMLNGEQNIGTSLHKITNQLIDKGEMIAQNTQEINYEKSYLDNTLSLYENGVTSIVTAVEQINQLRSDQLKTIAGTTFDESYYSFPDDQSVKKFLRNNQLVDEEALKKNISEYYGFATK